jgi:hypothetical protein
MKAPKGLTKEERRKWLKDNKQTNIPTICLEKKCRKEFLRKSVGYCKRCPECQEKINAKKNMPKKIKKELAQRNQSWGLHRKKYRAVLKELQELNKVFDAA